MEQKEHSGNQPQEANAGQNAAEGETRHFFVINPHSFGESGLDQIMADIDGCFGPDRKSSYDIFVSPFSRSAVSAVHRYIESTPQDVTVRVYAVGGDGILFECLNGMVDFPNAQLTSVPYGRANDFIRVFGENAREKFLDIKSLLAAPSRPIDVIKCGPSYAINQVGIGLEGQSTIDAGAFFRRHREKRIKPFVGLIYTLSGLLTAFNKELLCQEYRLKLDGEDYSGRYFNMALTNTPCSGGNLVTNTHSVPDDGLLNIVFANSCGVLTALKAIGDYTNSHFEKNDVFFHRMFKKLELSADLPIRVQLDGEAFYTDKLEVEVIPHGIRFFAPEGLDFADYSQRAYKGKKTKNEPNQIKARKVKNSSAANGADKARVKKGDMLQAYMPLNSLMKNTPNYMLIIDSDSRVRYISSQMLKFARFMRYEFAVDQPIIDLFHDKALKLMFTDIISAEGLYVAVTKISIDDKDRYFKVISDKLSDTTGGRFIDISDVTQIEENRLAAEDARRSADLANSAKSKFLALMSHEIRTPLTVVATGIDFVDELAASGDTAEMRKALGIVRDEIQRIGRMVSGMLNLASASDTAETRKRIDLAALLNNSAEMFRLTLEKFNNTVNVNIAPDIPDVYVEADRFTQVLTNLLTNAATHTQNGQVDITADHDESFIYVCIADTGKGISPEDLPHVFERGVSGGGGTGYGLYLCKAIVEAHGGTIKIESELGKSTAVTFSVPVYGGQEAEIPPA